MKNIKLTLLGTAALLIAVGLNIRHALNDYGVRDNKLHVEVLAQSNGSGGGGSNSGGGSGSTSDQQRGKSENAIVHCIINGNLTHANSTTSSTGTTWGFSGEVGVGNGFVAGNLGGNFGKTSDGSNGSYGLGSIYVYEEFWGRKYWCSNQANDLCSSYNPCLETLKEYRNLL